MSFEMQLTNGPADEEFRTCEAHLSDPEKNVLVFIGTSPVPQPGSRSSYRVRIAALTRPTAASSTWHFTGELLAVSERHFVTGYFETKKSDGWIHVRKDETPEPSPAEPRDEEFDVGGGD